MGELMTAQELCRILEVSRMCRIGLQRMDSSRIIGWEVSSGLAGGMWKPISKSAGRKQQKKGEQEKR